MSSAFQPPPNSPHISTSEDCVGDDENGCCDGNNFTLIMMKTLEEEELDFKGNTFSSNDCVEDGRDIGEDENCDDDENRNDEEDGVDAG